MAIVYYDSGVNATGPFGVRLEQRHSGGLNTLYKFTTVWDSRSRALSTTPRSMAAVRM
ncbi:MAG: hypothetical protein R2867_12555 [Caldilineaceae bacterium]